VVNHIPGHGATKASAAKRRSGGFHRATGFKSRISAVFRQETNVYRPLAQLACQAPHRGLRAAKINLKDVWIVRITRVLTLAAVAVSLSLPLPALAQDEAGKTDGEQIPPGQAQSVGPRKKKVQGQTAQKRPPPPKVENVASHGAWNIQCMEQPANADAGTEPGRACGMTQQAKSEKSDRVGLSIIVNKVKRGDKTAVFMRLMAPIGVYLPTGIPVEIDGTALPARMVFTRCVPPICEAMGEMSAETLAKFKKGGSSNFYLYDRPGNGYPIKISLEGFAAALDALDKI
jgi:invasion protein IalB